ncbi:ABC transporter ATP-binding protein [Streptomyces sp. G-G2]|uniref:ABC transporter ATP-binding protein n=1 Tax=Streptomyces sp. G-G2 TaxID=3046201 RepID=UPI0024B99AED|nr:ABC transporter ATP-binding protein [Streptomyces sp. G-G2]MDJ0382085.1 ABC transporter ATP-binding protein [Streptomyces sp. G-G2]
MSGERTDDRAGGRVDTHVGGADSGAGQPSYEELGRRAVAAAEPEALAADTAIACDRLVRVFSGDGIEVQALQGLELTVAQGDLVALVGASGSGKSTLLNILAGQDLPTAGTATVAGFDLLEMSSRDRLRYRREAVGFVWQQTARNLLPFLTATQNISLPMELADGGRKSAKRHAARTAELIEALDLGPLAGRLPSELSGGQQQRVAIAVAMAGAPKVLLADEPTGELDSETGAAVFEAFRTVNRELGATVVVVTHDPMVAGEVRRTVAIRDGRTSSEVLRRTVTDEHGAESVSEREYVMLDRSGRVQLPRTFLEALGMEHRVAVDLAADHIEVRPDSAA